MFGIPADFVGCTDTEDNCFFFPASLGSGRDEGTRVIRWQKNLLPLEKVAPGEALPCPLFCSEREDEVLGSEK